MAAVTAWGGSKVWPSARSQGLSAQLAPSDVGIPVPILLVRILELRGLNDSPKSQS